MVGESSWEQERPVSAPAVRPLGKADRAGGLGATNPISGEPDEMGESGAGVGGGRSSDEGVDNRTRRSEGPLAECAVQRRGSGIAERLFTRRTTSRRDGCWARGQRPWRGGMPRADCSGASRVRENRMHGSERGLETELRLVKVTTTAPAVYSAELSRGATISGLPISDGRI